jgi:hypothetical protein
MVKKNYMRQATRYPSIRRILPSIYNINLFAAANALICNVALAQANQQIPLPNAGAPKATMTSPPVSPSSVSPAVTKPSSAPVEAAPKSTTPTAAPNPTQTQSESPTAPAPAAAPVAASTSAPSPTQQAPQQAPQTVLAPPPADPPPLPVEWYAEWKSSAKSVRQKIVTKIAVTRLNQEKYEVIPAAENASLPSSFLQTPDDTEIALALATNKVDGGNGCDKSVTAVGICLNAQYVLDITADNWIVYYIDTKQEKATQILKAPKDEGDAYFTWLKFQLNYDTIALAQKGNFILALLPPAMTTPGIQGKIFANSSKEHALNKSTARAIGQIQLVKSQGRLGVFTMVSTGLYDRLKITPLSKILLDPIATPGGSNPQD